MVSAEAPPAPLAVSLSAPALVCALLKAVGLPSPLHVYIHVLDSSRPSEVPEVHVRLCRRSWKLPAVSPASATALEPSRAKTGEP